MRRRRRSRGTWFPTQYTVPNEGTPNAAVVGFDTSLAVNGDGSLQTNVLPLTFDVPNEGEHVNADTLVSIIGNEYLLKRIVGQITCVRNTEAKLSAAGYFSSSRPATLVAAGFFVARCDDANKDIPIGSTDRDAYSPLDVDTVREPWIWRRTWILGIAQSGNLSNSLLAATTSAPLAQTGGVAGEAYASFFPCSNIYYYNSLQSGYFDTKSKRRVGQDDRLWLAVATCNWPIGTDDVDDQDTQVDFHVDYRIFGALRRARNRSAF